MTDIVERNAKLAERLDPEPPKPSIEWNKWYSRHVVRAHQLMLATPSAQLAALVDLFYFALATKGWKATVGVMTGKVDMWNIDGKQKPIIIRKQPTAAALRAAMEEALNVEPE